MKNAKLQDTATVDAVLLENEQQANGFVAQCLLFTTVMIVLALILRTLGVFQLNDEWILIVSPIAITVHVLPYLIQRKCRIRSPRWKYIMMLVYILGVTVLATSLGVQVVLLWVCPILAACHYYSPKFLRFTLIHALIGMLIACYATVFIGLWDANIMRSTEVIPTIAGRVAYLQAQIAQGGTTYFDIFHSHYLPRATLLLFVYVLATLLCKRSFHLFAQFKDLQVEHDRVETELAVATNIQDSMLPRVFPTMPAFPENPELDLCATMHPAKAVGGDFYDFFRIDDDHIALVIADVSGKGVPAALFMVVSKTLLKNHTQATPSPKQVLEAVNNQLCEDNDAEMFVTVWLGIYQISTGILTAANAGHEYPILKTAGGAYVQYKDKHGFVLAGMEHMKYHEYQLPLAAGDTLFLYTDGVPEATNAHNQLYGSKRLLELLNRHKDATVTELLHHVKQDIDTFVGDAPQFDDITMLGFQVQNHHEASAKPHLQ